MSKPKINTEIIKVHVSPDDLEKLRYLADREGVPLSTYCRMSLKNDINYYYYKYKKQDEKERNI